MKRRVLQWIEKAEGQFHAASCIRRTHKRKSHDHICFWSHECATCYTKALLTGADVDFPVRCDLPKVLSKLERVEPLSLSMSRRLKDLSRYDMSVLYPGRSGTSKEAAKSFETCIPYRSLARASLGLKP